MPTSSFHPKSMLATEMHEIERRASPCRLPRPSRCTCPQDVLKIMDAQASSTWSISCRGYRREETSKVRPQGLGNFVVKGHTTETSKPD